MRAGSHHLRAKALVLRGTRGGCEHYPTVVLDAVKPGASYFWMPVRHSWGPGFHTGTLLETAWSERSVKTSKRI